MISPTVNRNRLLQTRLIYTHLFLFFGLALEQAKVLEWCWLLETDKVR